MSTIKWHGVLLLFLIFMFLRHGHVFAETYIGRILVDDTGGTCQLVGTWNVETKTCTLTKDIQGPVQMSTPDITLDGGGHVVIKNTTTSPSTERIGISISGARSTLKNITVNSFTTGIVLTGSGNVGSRIENVTVSRAGSGGILALPVTSGHTLIGNTVKDSYFGIQLAGSNNIVENNVLENNSTKGLWLQGSNTVVKNNSFRSNLTGVSADTGGNHTITDNTFENNRSFGFYANSSLSNYVVHNNFIGNGDDQVVSSIRYYVSDALPIGGNYWSTFDEVNEGCTDLDLNTICDLPKYFLYGSTYGDLFPWTKKDGWKQSALPPQYFAPIRGAVADGKKMYTEALGEVIKTLPIDWIVKVFSSSTNTVPGWIQIEDPTDGSQGWIEGTLGDLAYESEKQQMYSSKAVTQLTTKEERADRIKEAIHHYVTNTSTSPSLYSGRDTVNFSIFNQIGFPEELALAIAAQESGGTYNFNNELVSFDYGHGAMQITFHAWAFEPLNFNDNKWDNRGKYSGIKIPMCRNINVNSLGERESGSAEYKNCYKNTLTKNTLRKPYDNYEHIASNPIYKQYSNTVQSIYANVKDGLGNLQVDKYHSKCPRADLVLGTLTFTCHDIEKILMVWGYNGISFKPDVQYLKNVSEKLSTLSANFPGVSYSNTDKLIEKLRLANDNRKSVKVYSPVELSVVDRNGNITGIQHGVQYEDIPNSNYFADDEVVAMLFPEDGERYIVTGTSNGTYGITVESVQNGEIVTFTGTELPISLGEVHKYSVDHEKVARGEKGVTVEIDTEGDGVVDRTLQVGTSLTDITPPTLEVEHIANEYILGHVVHPQVVSDDVSMPVTIEYTLNGANTTMPLILTKPGLHKLKIAATDAVGNTTTKEFQFYARYVFNGFLSPIQNDGSGIYKLNSTLPLKFSLSDINNANVGEKIATLSVKKITNTILGDEEYVVNNVGPDQGTVFRYDTITKQYTYNLSTKSLTKGTWQVSTILDDGSRHTVQISLN